jgi:hypothetical protein
MLVFYAFIHFLEIYEGIKQKLRRIGMLVLRSGGKYENFTVLCRNWVNSYLSILGHPSFLPNNITSNDTIVATNSIIDNKMTQIFSWNCKKLLQTSKEDLILIWFASTIEITEDIEKTMDDLQRLNDDVFFFNKIDLCIDLIKSLKRKKIFLIVSAENAYQSLPNILHLSQLDSIFVYPANRAHYRRLFDDFHKIVNIFNNLDELKISIKENMKHFNRQVELFSFYDLHQQSLRDISTQSAEFLS